MTNAGDERSRSIWMEIPPPRFPRLEQPITTDVLVVGAGIAGLSIAYEMASLGRQVTVVDRGSFGRGMTARTTAHLAFEIDDFFRELIKSHGKDHARLWYESQKAAVDRIEEIIHAEGIECDFARVDGIFVPADEKDIDYLKEELTAAQQAGFTDAEWITDGAGEWSTPGIRFPRQARFHPTKYLNGLIDALGRKGALFYEGAEVVTVREEAGRVEAETSDGLVITAKQAAFATNSPTHAPLPIHTKQAPYRTYVIAMPVPKGSVPDVLLWDTVEPGYHYVRIQPGEDQDMVIVGGEDHKSGVEDDGEARIARLEAWARARYDGLGRIAYAWSGQVMEPADYVGLIGKTSGYDEVYLASGDSGQGMTTGVVAALLLRDLMSGQASPWAELYEPRRTMHRGLGDFVKENLEATKHWLELAGRGEVSSADRIRPGEGAVLKVGLKPVAAYRDEGGALHAVSAVCTHAGCMVHWNGFEGCWDCPCHGSQFGVDGEVLNGPAVKPLPAADLKDEDERSEARDAPDAERWRPGR